MKHVKWRFKDVGPDFATPEGMEKKHQQRMRIIMGLAEDHEIVYDGIHPDLQNMPTSQYTMKNVEVETLIGDTILKPNNKENDGHNTTDDSAGDSNSDVDKPKTISKRSRRSKTKPKTP